MLQITNPAAAHDELTNLIKQRFTHYLQPINYEALAAYYPVEEKKAAPKKEEKKSAPAQDEESDDEAMSFDDLEEAPKKKAAPKKSEDSDDDFMTNLSDDEEDDAAAAIIAKKKAEADAAKGEKKKDGPVAKSSIVLDVKPESSETDMNALEKAVRNIKMDGLHWGAADRVPVAYGVFKLRIMATVLDEVCSVDELQENIEALEDVQSTDIEAFNKI